MISMFRGENAPETGAWQWFPANTFAANVFAVIEKIQVRHMNGKEV